MALPIPSLLITPENTRDRNGPVALSESGAVRRVPFDGGQAFFVEEGTTNLAMNPSVETNINWWAAIGSGITLDRITTDSVFGDAAMRITSADAGRHGWLVQTGPITAPAGTVFTGSIYVKFPVGLTVRMLVREDTGGAFSSINTESTGDWQRIVLSHTLTVDNPSYLHIRVDSNADGYFAYADGAQIEQKPYATSFTHGDMGTGYSWTGTPHASASVRQPSYAYATHPMPLDEGSVYIRWQAENISGRNQYIGGLGIIGGANEVILSAYINANGIQAVRTRPTHHPHGTLTPTDKGHRNLYIEYAGETTASDFREGGGRIESGRDFPDAPWDSNRMSIGFSGDTGIQGNLNGYVAALIAYDTPLTEAEIARLDAIPTSELTWANLMPKIGGVRTVHSPAPFALASTHNPAPFATRSIHEEV